MKLYSSVNDELPVIEEDSEQEQLNNEKFCPECNGQLVFDDHRGEIACSRCGLVIKEKRIDLGQEWRAYTSQEANARSRVGDPVEYSEELELKSKISLVSNLDGKGNTLPLKRRYQFRRLARLDSNTRSNRIRNLRIAYRELTRLTSQLELPDLINRSSGIIYRRALKMDLIRGRSIESMVVASVYLACRENSVPITLKDIAEVCPNLSLKEISRCVRTMISLMKFKPKPSDLKAMVYSLGEKLKLSMETRALAVSIIELAKKKGLTVGKSPMAIVGAALYIAGIQNNERRTQLEYSRISRTTPVTLRNRFKEMISLLPELSIVQVDRKMKRGPS